jgi:HprK-related kinase A
MSWPHYGLRIGPVSFLLRTPFRRVMRDVAALYRDYPATGNAAIHDFVVSAVPDGLARRWLRPKFRLHCDFEPFETLPLPRRLGLLGFEMGMNLQMAAGWRRHVVFHAAAAARASADGDRALLLIGASGAGKSTLSALLAYAGGWRHLGDEFALLDLAAPGLVPFPRPISLKNAAIDTLLRHAPVERFGPLLEGTLKGTIRHLLPPADAIVDMDRPARLALIVAPRFEPGATPAWRPMTRTETYTRLAASSTNQTMLAEAGFEAVWRALEAAPAFDIVYGAGDDALILVDGLWRQVAQ